MRKLTVFFGVESSSSAREDLYSPDEDMAAVLVVDGKLASDNTVVCVRRFLSYKTYLQANKGSRNSMFRRPNCGARSISKERKL